MRPAAEVELRSVTPVTNVLYQTWPHPWSATEIIVPCRSVASSSMTCCEPAPPPPPPIEWQEYICFDEETQRRIPYFYNMKTDVSQWDAPTVPYHHVVPSTPTAEP